MTNEEAAAKLLSAWLDPRKEEYGMAIDALQRIGGLEEENEKLKAELEKLHEHLALSIRMRERPQKHGE